jgi:hypothetical protein
MINKAQPKQAKNKGANTVAAPAVNNEKKEQIMDNLIKKYKKAMTVLAVK